MERENEQVTPADRWLTEEGPRLADEQRRWGSPGWRGPTVRNRWMVVDRNRTPVFTGMYRRENAEGEAERLNAEGLPEGRPYTVVRDLHAEKSGR